VVDNASTDGTWNILLELQKEDSRLRIFRNECNIGPVRNWLRCVEEARGECSKILWSDDLISPNYLEKTVPLLTSDTGFVYTAARVSFDQGMEGGEIHYSNSELPSKYETSLFIDSVFQRGGDVPVSPGCALLRTSDLRNVLDLNVANRIGSDFSMHAIGPDLLIFLRLCSQYNYVSFLNEPLSIFRAHEDSITVQESATGKLVTMYNVAKGTFLEEVGVRGISEKSLRHFLKKLSSSRSLEKASSYGIATWKDYFPSDEFSRELKRYLPLRRKINFFGK